MTVSSAKPKGFFMLQYHAALNSWLVSFPDHEGLQLLREFPTEGEARAWAQGKGFEELAP